MPIDANFDGGQYSLNAPPQDAENSAKMAWKCFLISAEEKKRLSLIERWKENYKLYRGDHWQSVKSRENRNQVTINLFFANVLRTTANITNRQPMVEVIDLDGIQDKSDIALTNRMKKQWGETEQQASLAHSVLLNEINGITIEKSIWNPAKKQSDVSVIDAHSFFPAPGKWKEINDMPYASHAYIMSVDDIETKFGVTEVQPDDFSSILGKDREATKPTLSSVQDTVIEDAVVNSGDAAGSFVKSGVSGRGKALVVETWMRDWTEIQPTRDELSANNPGQGLTKNKKRLKYPDGIRVITTTNQGRKVLSDQPNPNINWQLFIRDVPVWHSWAWGRIPMWHSTSYEDPIEFWGFSAAEQVGPLNKKIDEIVSRLLAYIQRTLLPPLIVSKSAGIPKNKIKNQPGLVFRPVRDTARIEYMQVPELPQSFFNVLDTIITMHDRIYQIEDADRGVQPTGVTAASAIVALQERNAVLIQHKIRSADRLIRNRGRWSVSHYQNFSTKTDSVEIQGKPVTLQGIRLAGRRYNFVVESGSTVARTSIREEEQATQLYEMGVIDRRALLETLNFRGWRDVVERIGEGQLDKAMSILVDAGLPEDAAIKLKNFLLTPQQTTGGGQSEQPQPGTPKAQQGGQV